jgi:hypothetical protein
MDTSSSSPSPSSAPSHILQAQVSGQIPHSMPNANGIEAFLARAELAKVCCLGLLPSSCCPPPTLPSMGACTSPGSRVHSWCCLLYYCSGIPRDGALPIDLRAPSTPRARPPRRFSSFSCCLVAAHVINQFYLPLVDPRPSRPSLICVLQGHTQPFPCSPAHPRAPPTSIAYAKPDHIPRAPSQSPSHWKRSRPSVPGPQATSKPKSDDAAPSRSIALFRPSGEYPRHRRRLRHPL